MGPTCHWPEISGASERNGKSINRVWGRRRPRQEVHLSPSFSQISVKSPGRHPVEAVWYHLRVLTHQGTLFSSLLPVGLHLCPPWASV